MLDFDVAYVILAGVFSAGAAAGGAKVVMNGTKQRVQNLEQSHLDIVDRLARIETKLDMLVRD